MQILYCNKERVKDSNRDVRNFCDNFCAVILGLQCIYWTVHNEVS